MRQIIEKLKEKGYDTVPDDFYSLIDTWRSWYDGDVKNFHSYSVFNGQNLVNCHRYTMGMAKKVAEDWANLLMNEKVQITLEGTKEQEFFDTVCTNNNFWVKMNEMQELKSGLGTTAYVMRVDGAEVNGETGYIEQSEQTAIKIDYVTAQNIFPISWDNGIVRECAFTSSRTVQGINYLYLQLHHIGDNGTYVIENSIYKDSNGTLSETSLADVKGFERVPPVVYTGSTTRQFVIDRLNIANNVDYTLPMGIPAFANAIDCLKGVDIAYDSYINEFVLGKKKIMVKPAATKNLETGEPSFDLSELTYYILPEDSEDGNVITPIDMSLRTAEHNAGIQDMLNTVSSRCGFGENHYRYGNEAATATQIVSENSTLFRTIKKHEIILEDVLKEMCRIILRMGNAYLGMKLNEDVEISIDFDDSIIESREQEEARTYLMLSNDLITRAEARAMLMNEDIKTAEESLPDMEQLTVGAEQYEVE